MEPVKQELKRQVQILGGLVLLFWVLEFLDAMVLRGSLDRYGIFPRTAIGLRGIVFAPFLHGSFYHVAANTIPFLVLGWLVMLRETGDFFVVSAVSAIASGLGTWLLGSPGVHIGASGVIFGYLGYLLFRGYFERSLTAIALSLLVAFAYGGLIWGVLPGRYGISWESHLFGFVGGILAAKLLGDRRPTASK